jgi:hypothetical protein
VSSLLPLARWMRASAILGSAVARMGYGRVTVR